METDAASNLPRAIELWPEDQIPFASEADGELPRLTYYLPSKEYRTGQTMLILPGGGYRSLSTYKEGHRPAQFLTANGIASGVLEYRHAPQRFPVPLIDAQRALRILRAEAQKHYDLDSENVGCMGFSAGGHLSGLLATQPAIALNNQSDGIDQLNCRPDFFAMVYAVVALGESFTHTGSQMNLLGPSAPNTLVQQLSVEKAVDSNSPPCFITHSQKDPVVPVENAIALYRSLSQHEIDTTMYLFEGKKHGIGLANNHSWAKQMLAWLDALPGTNR